MATLKKMKTEQDFIDSVKRANPSLFVANKIQMKPATLEALLRLAYRQSKKDLRESEPELPDFMKSVLGR